MIRVLLTLGDPTGIGSELVIKVLLAICAQRGLWARQLYKALAENRLELALLGSRPLLHRTWQAYAVWGKAYTVGWREKNKLILSSQTNPEQRVSIKLYDEPLVPLEAYLPGKPSQKSGAYALRLLERACALIAAAQADVLVTGPLSKEKVAQSMPHFLGHTEYLADYFKRLPQLFATKASFLPHSWREAGCCGGVSMGFVTPTFNLTLMTRHIALRDVARRLTLPTITRTLLHAYLLAQLTARKEVKTPISALPAIPIGILAVNPHGGDGGLFGNEEKRLKEASEKTQQILTNQQKRLPGIPVCYEGPLAADTAYWYLGKGKPYKNMVACYHDQGLIALKILAGMRATNVTLGLPFIRTSADHGPAFNIAGTYQADATSALYALYTAWKLHQQYTLGYR